MTRQKPRARARSSKALEPLSSSLLTLAREPGAPCTRGICGHPPHVHTDGGRCRAEGCQCAELA